MEFTFQDIDKIKLGDSLVLDIDPYTGSFPNEYAEAIRTKSQALNAEMKAYVFAEDLKLKLLFKDKNFKKIGVVIDNYKIAKFKSELLKKGFDLFEASPFGTGTTAFTFDIPTELFEKKKAQIFAIVNLVETHFKRSN